MISWHITNSNTPLLYNPPISKYQSFSYNQLNINNPPQYPQHPQHPTPPALPQNQIPTNFQNIRISKNSPFSNVLIIPKNLETNLFCTKTFYRELEPFIKPDEFFDLLNDINEITEESIIESRSKYKSRIFDITLLLVFISVLIFFIITGLYRVAIITCVTVILIGTILRLTYYFLTKEKIEQKIELGFDNYYFELSQKLYPLVFKGLFRKIQSSKRSGWEFIQTALIIEYPTFIKTPYVFQNPLNNNNTQNQNQNIITPPSQASIPIPSTSSTSLPSLVFSESNSVNENNINNFNNNIIQDISINLEFNQNEINNNINENNL
ncbi:hypothetical protein DICPUDRAFT_80621 [Dictyostelium purpureum]|uniref:Uncharacterized protein n=1 Tax=Dictyostelium purpureum TaxID=5786 RepID=F0ZR13_DICPU|nr:uncharacterized protein DICPUDRAFT_80621 [Dictyostelium purpureum]EGC33627.1 hypothetical protein DICPUDRAFT_80621 [Dictyostelium purpureum]|eukprot:XP_003289847.1 hypothetical protein DICPUDRAFT_80621 [Dictyostelium purpureum]